MISGLRTAIYTLTMMTSSPLQLQKQGPTRDEADKLFDESMKKLLTQTPRDSPVGARA